MTEATSVNWMWTGTRRDRGRVELLGRLRHEVARLGVRARLMGGITKPACLRLRGESVRTERVLCLGVGPTYTFVTEKGRLLGVADETEIGEAARSLVWLLDPPVALDTPAER